MSQNGDIKLRSVGSENMRFSLTQLDDQEFKEELSRNTDDNIDDEPIDDRSLSVQERKGESMGINKFRRSMPSPNQQEKFESSTTRYIQFYQPSSKLMSILSPVDPTIVTNPEIDFCKCTRSRCLMLYCDCFQAGQVCNPSCVCVSCKNIRSQSKSDGARFQAIEAILLRRPDAFQFRPKNSEDGCKCKKNRCLKKYCECFNMGLLCTPNCRCEECQNDGQEPTEHHRRTKKNVMAAEKIEQITKEQPLNEIEKLFQPIPPSQIEFNPSTENAKKRKVDVVPIDSFYPVKLSYLENPMTFSSNASNSYFAIDSIVPLLTEAHYVNMEALMYQLLKLPYLSDFCRSVTDQKVQSSPLNFSIVHHRVKNRMYTSGGSIFNDVIHVIRNGAKNQSLVSMNPRAIYAKADHLIEYFSTLWLEYMVPSDVPYFSNVRYDHSSLVRDPVVSEQEDEGEEDYAEEQEDEDQEVGVEEGGDISSAEITSFDSQSSVSIVDDDASSIDSSDEYTDNIESAKMKSNNNRSTPDDFPSENGSAQPVTTSTKPLVFETGRLPSVKREYPTITLHKSVQRSRSVDSTHMPGDSIMLADKPPSVDESIDEGDKQKESAEEPMSCSSVSAHIKPVRRRIGNRSSRFGAKGLESTEVNKDDVSCYSSKSSPSLRIKSNLRPMRRTTKSGLEKSPSSESESETRRKFTRQSEARKNRMKVELNESLKRNDRQPMKNDCNLSKERERDNDSNHRDDHRFPETLHAFVEEVSTKAPYILNWTSNGEAFVIKKPDEVGPFLIRYFNHSRYSSLQRQLNMYGFKKHTKGKYTGSFHHPNFHQNLELAKMSAFKRRAPIRTSSISRSKKGKRTPGTRKGVAQKTRLRVHKSNKRNRRLKDSSEIDSKLAESIVKHSSRELKLARKVKKKVVADDIEPMVNERTQPLPKKAKLIQRKTIKDKAILDKEALFTQEQCPDRDQYFLALKDAFQLREQKRFIRMKMLALTTYLPLKSLQSLTTMIETFVQSSGCVDMLDPRLQVNNNDALNEYFSCLLHLIEKLRSMVVNKIHHEGSNTLVSDYSLNQLYRDLLVAHSVIVDPKLTEKVRGRIHRLLGRFTAPIFEISSRGVSRSSVWACPAAVVWAKNDKKSFRPALVIGILAHKERHEEWHEVLTELNELRLPRKLRAKLSIEKNAAKTDIQAGGTSYFLIEFLGMNEFSWVAEECVIEDFDPQNDPNLINRYSRLTNSLPSYQTTIDEAQLVLEEIDIQMTELETWMW